jgi:hypothetical protein
MKGDLDKRGEKHTAVIGEEQPNKRDAVGTTTAVPLWTEHSAVDQCKVCTM